LQKLLIDENLSPSLELLAHERGFVCSHVNHLGKTGQKDSPVRDDDEGTAACHGYQINTFTLSTRPQNRTNVKVRSRFRSGLFTTPLPGLAPVSSARALPPTTRKASAVAGMMTRVYQTVK
jgi:hypothetical protein